MNSLQYFFAGLPRSTHCQKVRCSSRPKKRTFDLSAFFSTLPWSFLFPSRTHKRDLISEIIHGNWVTSLHFPWKIFAWVSSQWEVLPYPAPVYHHHGVFLRHIDSTFNTVTGLSTTPWPCRWPIFTKRFKPRNNVVWFEVLSFLFGAYWTQWVIALSLWSWLVKTFCVKDVLTWKHSCDRHVSVS